MAYLPLVVLCSFGKDGVIALHGLVDEHHPLGMLPSVVEVQVGTSLTHLTQKIKREHGRRPEWLLSDGVGGVQHRSIRAHLPAAMSMHDFRRPLAEMEYGPVPPLPSIGQAEAMIKTHFSPPVDARLVETVHRLGGGRTLDPSVPWHIWHIGLETVHGFARAAERRREGRPNAYDHIMGTE